MMMLRKMTAIGVFLAAGVMPIESALADLIYDPVVTVVGTQGTALASSGSMTSIYVYGRNVANQSAPVSSVSYNSTGTGLINSGTATSEASLTNNPGVSDAAAQGVRYNGPQYVYSGGYNAATGGTSSISSTAANAPRAVGVATVTNSMASNATVLKTQTQATAYDNNNIRGANGDDLGAGATLYSAGTATTATLGGWRNFNSNTQIGSSPTNVRTVESLGGKLFGSTGSGSTVGIYIIDPTGVSAPVSFVSTGTSSNHSPYEFALFKDPNNHNSTNGYNVAYIADDGFSGAAAAGVEKWVYNGTSWTQAYKLFDASITGLTGYRGLAGQLDASNNGTVALFATGSDGTSANGNGTFSVLEQITDNLSATSLPASDTYMTLASMSVTNGLAFRGVALAVPEAPAFLLGFAVCSVVGLSYVGRRKREAVEV
jgi:hypothetical protein